MSSMNHPTMTNIGAYFVGVPALDPATATAAGGGDGVARNGIAIDRFAHAQLFNACKFQVPIVAVLTATKTAVVTLKCQDSADDSSWADYVFSAAGDVDPASVTLTGGAGGTTERAVLALNVDLVGARQYIRAVVTPELNASGTDTAVTSGICNLGGGPDLPAAL
jgi:hypothetical protein